MAQAQKSKKPRKELVTPLATAAYASVHKIDDHGKFATGKYKVTLVFDADTNLDAMTEAAWSLAREAFPGEKDIKLPFKDGTETGKEEFKGKTLVTAKSQFRPEAVDAKRKPLPANVQVWHGDRIKALIALIPYESTERVKENGKMVTHTVYGISAALKAVQLIEKRAGGAGNSQFSEEDGYEGGSEEAPADNGSTGENGGDY